MGKERFFTVCGPIVGYFLLLAVVYTALTYDKPVVVKPTPPKPEQPVYILITCPKVGGDYVYEITEDLKLRYLAGES